MQPVVLFRAGLREEDELEACRRHLPVVTQRSHVKAGQLVVPRYSALPYYRELEEDIKHVGAKLINTYEEHLYVADLQNWYEDLKDYTPKTWFRVEDTPNDTKLVLKGETNSKKHLWNSHMYAENKRAAGEVMCRLQDDDFLQDQRIYAREYVPLHHLCDGLQGLPISEEYRFFQLGHRTLCSGFYWSNYGEHLREKGFNLDPNNVPKSFLNKIIRKVAKNIPFFVIDVARTKDNDWIVVELNDGQMSGPSECDAETMYSNLRKFISCRDSNGRILL